MNKRLREQTLSVLLALALGGCASTHVSPPPAKGYPGEWGEVLTPGPGCKDVEGAYFTSGRRENGDRVSLVDLLDVDIARDTKIVSLRRQDVRTVFGADSGLTDLALRVSPLDNAAVFRDLESCHCYYQELYCTVFEASRYFPIGTQSIRSSVYFSISRDGSLITKFSHYEIGHVFFVPYYRPAKERWARFERADK